MQSQKLCLKWNNHTSNLLSVLGSFQQNESLVDVTISCEGHNIKAHKIVLSASSPYFQDIFLENPCKHPIIFMNGMKFEDVAAILNFMYKGEVNVSHDGLSSFLQAAEALKVKGLAEVCGEKNSTNSISQEVQQSEQSRPQRTDTPPRKRQRNRKRSLSDSNRSDDEGSSRKHREPSSPEVHELSGDESFTGDNSSNGTPFNSTPRVPHQKSFSRSHQSNLVEEDEYEMEAEKLLEQNMTTESASVNNSTPDNNLRIERIMGNATEMESSSLQEPESPPVPTQKLEAVCGSRVSLPCIMTSPLADDQVALVLWYKGDMKVPIYTLDAKWGRREKPKHFSIEKLSKRIHFDVHLKHPGLSIDPVKQEDEGNWRCRVEYKKYKTVTYNYILKVVDASARKKLSSSNSSRSSSNSVKAVNQSEIKDNFDLLHDMEFRFPKLLSTRLEKNERPTASERREIVRFIVSEVMDRIPVPRKRHLEIVASNFVRKYPRSFSDTIGSNLIGRGHGSLLCQLIARAENCRRAMAGKVNRPSVISAGGIAKKKTVAHMYGCVNFQPELPTDETEESQKEKQTYMKKAFTEADKDMSLVRQYMQSTFAYQRFTINKGVSVAHILSEWPYLSKREFFFSHIEHLMGFSLTKKMEECIQKKLPEMEKFFKGNKDLHLNYLHILTEHFDENIDVCLKIYEKNKTLKEIKEEVPSTPFIACIGNPFTLEDRCTVFIEKENLEALIPLNEALIMWFGSFYLFNLVYPKECCATLEFIQRVFYGINPDSRGSKMEKRFGKRINMYPKVLKLINEIRDCNS